MKRGRPKGPVKKMVCNYLPTELNQKLHTYAEQKDIPITVAVEIAVRNLISGQNNISSILHKIPKKPYEQFAQQIRFMLHQGKVELTEEQLLDEVALTGNLRRPDTLKNYLKKLSPEMIIQEKHGRYIIEKKS